MNPTKLAPKQKFGPLLQPNLYEDTKDPCVVFDGIIWHKYGSGGNVRNEKWQVLHATSPSLFGPWQELPPVNLIGLTGDHTVAPGVIFDGGIFHMFIMTEFMAPGGTIEYLTSKDSENFTRQKTVLFSRRKTDEAGLYDPHPAIINSQKYLVYAAMPEVFRQNKFVCQPNIYLAKSKTNSWRGPWQRVGKILDHVEIAEHHNQTDHPNYEWGIEGPQLVGLPNGKILLNATCFLPTGEFGTRQRVFFAIADQVTGPYLSLGPVLEPSLDSWGDGENGHAAGFMDQEKLFLFYQARPIFTQEKKPWRYGLAIFDAQDLKAG